MRTLLYAMFSVVFALLLFGAAAPEHAGTPSDPWVVWNEPTLAISWDPYETTLGWALCEVVNDESEATVSQEYTLEPGVFKVGVYELVSGVPNGTYRIRVKVADTNRNWSDWSATYWATKDWQEVQAPGGCALTW